MSARMMLQTSTIRSCVCTFLAQHIPCTRLRLSTLVCNVYTPSVRICACCRGASGHAAHAIRAYANPAYFSSCLRQLRCAPILRADSSCHCVSSNQLASQSRDEPSCRRCTIPALSAEEAELASDLLLGYGAQSVVVEEYRPPGSPEQEIFDDGANQQQLWDQCTVVAHFPMEVDPMDAVEVVRGVVERDELGEVVEEVVPREWVEAIKASYVPLKVTEGVWIIPEWSQPKEEGALNIVLQPGVAFGTGEHPTTRLCLQSLLRMQLEGVSVMDYGSGSGVLAIAALLRGAATAVGTDVDPLAVRAAARNAELSGVSDRLQVLQCGASLEDPEPLSQAGEPGCEFDVVVANILRGPLLELAPRLAGYAKPGGQLLLSGILIQQAEDILAAYSQYFTTFSVEEEEGWALVTATRK